MAGVTACIKSFRKVDVIKNHNSRGDFQSIAIGSESIGDSFINFPETQLESAREFGEFEAASTVCGGIVQLELIE